MMSVPSDPSGEIKWNASRFAEMARALSIENSTSCAHFVECQRLRMPPVSVPNDDNTSSELCPVPPPPAVGQDATGCVSRSTAIACQNRSIDPCQNRSGGWQYNGHGWIVDTRGQQARVNRLAPYVQVDPNQTHGGGMLPCCVGLHDSRYHRCPFVHNILSDKSSHYSSYYGV